MRGFEPRLGLFKNIHVYLRGYSLIGKTAILHIVILGSSPNISNPNIKYYINIKYYVKIKYYINIEYNIKT